MFSLRPLVSARPRTYPSIRPFRGVPARTLPAAYLFKPAFVSNLQSQKMTNKTASGELHITPIEEDDYEEWERLFRLYIIFYKSSLPDAQYRKTFERILDPQNDLYGLVLRDTSDPRKLYGLAHYFPMQTPWAEEKLIHLNDLYVDHELRGKGYGRKIIQAVAEEAKKQGSTRLQWTTQHGNPARKLYDELATCEFVHYRMDLKSS